MTEKRRSSDREITDVQLAARVSRAVEIDRILLRQVTVKSAFNPSLPPVDLTPEQEVGAVYELSADDILVRVTFALLLSGRRPGETEGVEALEVSAVYEVLYVVSGEATFSDEELAHFAKLNGTVNLWPYWRELVHTVAARTGLGSITLPVYRVKPTVIDRSSARSDDTNA